MSAPLDDEPKDPDEEVDAQEVETEDDPLDEEGVFVGFADEVDEDEAEQTPLIKRLREQIRDRDRKIAQYARPSVSQMSDPEPQISPEPGNLSDFDYDEDKHAAAVRKHIADQKAHLEWDRRQEERKREIEQAEKDRVRKVEMQKGALGVNDFDVRAGLVKDRLNDAQLAILLEGTDNAAALIYALGKSENKLDQLAGETNLTRFAVMVGKMEKDVKMGKRRPPAPEARVRGNDASVTGVDRELERLERDADRTGVRTNLIRYKREKGLL